MNFIQVIVAIVTWGAVYTVSKVMTYKMLSKIDLSNLEVIYGKIPKLLRKTAKYLKSKKCKDTLTDLNEAINQLFDKEEETEEPASEEE